MRTAAVLIALLLILPALPAAAGPDPGTGISGSFHDLSITAGKGNWYGDVFEQSGQDRVCVYCHAPHHTLLPTDTMPYVPLWNHLPSRNTAFLMYMNGSDLYAPFTNNQISPTLFTGEFGIPGPPSMLCLSCHDGSVAVSAYGFYPSGSIGARNGPRMWGRGQIGNAADLRNHHPVGFDYNEAYARNILLNNPAMPVRGINRYGLTINDLLWYGRVECTTCHDVHNDNNEGQKFTWVDDRQSRFCLSCHIK